MNVIQRHIEQFECPACGITIEKEGEIVRAKVLEKPQDTQEDQADIIGDDTPTVEILTNEIDPMS